jgi:NDP-sugar pyrophosphorylase family protein
MLAVPGLLYGFQSDAYWLDIGTPEKYLQAHDDVLAGRLGYPPAPGATERGPGVWVQGDATIDVAASIEPPALVGPGARIEGGARVRRSVLGAGAVVEAGAEVDRSVLHAGTVVSRGSSMHDSVIGSDSVLKPEAALTDETLVGASVTIASGTRISGGRVPSS